MSVTIERSAVFRYECDEDGCKEYREIEGTAQPEGWGGLEASLTDGKQTRQVAMLLCPKHTRLKASYFNVSFVVLPVYNKEQMPR